MLVLLSGAILTSTVLASIAGIPISSASFVLTIASIMFNPCLDSVKMRNRKLQDYVNMTILLYEKTTKKALQDNIIDEKEQKELKDIYQYYLDEKNNIKKSTQFDVNKVYKSSFGELAKIELISEEMVAKLNDFLMKIPNQK